MILLVITSLKPLERATKAQKSTAKWQWRVFIFAIVIPVQAMITLLLVCGLFVPYFQLTNLLFVRGVTLTSKLVTPKALGKCLSFQVIL